MAQQPVVVKSAVSARYNKPHPRNRSRNTYTLSDETIEALKSLVETKEAGSLSRAVELCVEHFLNSKSKLTANFESEKDRKNFVSRCVKDREVPGIVLARLASLYTQS